MLCSSCSQAHPRSHQPIKVCTKRAQGHKGRWEPETRTQKKGHPACIPPRAGPAQPQPQAWNSPRWVNSAFGTEMCCCPGAWDSSWDAGEGHLDITQALCGQPRNIGTMVNFLISFYRWASDKMHEENNNEKTSRKKSPYYSSSLHIVNVLVHWCLAPFWCLPS